MTAKELSLLPSISPGFLKVALFVKCLHTCICFRGKNETFLLTVLNGDSFFFFLMEREFESPSVGRLVVYDDQMFLSVSLSPRFINLREGG